MMFLKIATICILSITGLGMLIFGLRCGKPFKWLFVNALLGIASFAAIVALRRFTGVSIPCNGWTVSSVLFLGVPAVCGLLLLPLIF